MIKVKYDIFKQLGSLSFWLIGKFILLFFFFFLWHVWWYYFES